MKSKSDYALDDVLWKLQMLRDLESYEENDEEAEKIDKIIDSAMELVVEYGNRKFQEGHNHGVETIERACITHKNI